MSEEGIDIEAMNTLIPLDNSIEISISSEGCSVSAHSNERSFDDLKKAVDEILRSLPHNKKEQQPDVNIS